MEALLAAEAAGELPAVVSAVIANRSDAQGLETARARGIEAVSVDHKAFDSRAAFDAALAAVIDRYAPDLVVLAGFMRILSPTFVQRYEGRLMNIHPALLPAFPGLHTHERALAAGCKVHGATVHLVTPELDHGPIIVQSAVPVMPDDDVASLAARVLVTEHVIYPRAVGWFVRDQLLIVNGVVRVNSQAHTPQGSGMSPEAAATDSHLRTVAPGCAQQLMVTP